ncbi:MAG: hypothetical protein OS130_04260 [Thermodesulfobacteriota bacterium]|jgi:hypothetical protein|nr:MAG: hypothetical protein OS130_04260 [Thermodesulfobacteriota bacterium]
MPWGAVASIVVNVVKEILGVALEEMGLDLDGLENILEDFSDDQLNKFNGLLNLFRDLQLLAGSLHNGYENINASLVNCSLEELMAGDKMSIIWSLHETLQRVFSALKSVFKALKAFIDIMPSDQQNAIWEMLDSKDGRFRGWLENV